LEKVAQFIPDLVLLDVNMPQMDGWQLLKALKSSPATSTIPVIMCTERNLIREIEEAGALGADGYILKPFEVERVVRKVEETLKK
jgi:chemosensory pili system protein ChpA (sensor histidine kinase/response regulator)